MQGCAAGERAGLCCKSRGSSGIDVNMSRLVHAPLFRGRHFGDDVITLAVEWYLSDSLSYRNRQDMLSQRGVCVDSSTLCRWVHRYARVLEFGLRPRRSPTGKIWHLDETYIRVRGEWAYLYRAVDEGGATVDFFLSPTRNEHAAKLFFRHALVTVQQPAPEQIVVDGNPTYPIVVRALQREGLLPAHTKYKHPYHGNNQIEQDHRGIQRRVRAKQGFRSWSGARAAIAG
jgi:transposase, IS6 family